MSRENVNRGGAPGNRRRGDPVMRGTIFDRPHPRRGQRKNPQTEVDGYNHIRVGQRPTRRATQPNQVGCANFVG